MFKKAKTNALSILLISKIMIKIIKKINFISKISLSLMIDL